MNESAATFDAESFLVERPRLRHLWYPMQAVVCVRSLSRHDGECCLGVNGCHGLQLPSSMRLVILNDAERVDPKISLSQHLNQANGVSDGSWDFASVVWPQ